MELWDKQESISLSRFGIKCRGPAWFVGKALSWLNTDAGYFHLNCNGEGVWEASFTDKAGNCYCVEGTGSMTAITEMFWQMEGKPIKAEEKEKSKYTITLMSSGKNLP